MSLVDTSPRSVGMFEVGPLAFGCWRFVSMDTHRARELVEAAVSAGMNLIDTADVYGLGWGGTHFGEAEEILGAVLREAPELREVMVLATKGGIAPSVPYDSSAKYIRNAVDDSLRRMSTDFIDLYQIHRPDMYTHPESLAATLTNLRDAGKIREVGVSNYTPTQTAALAAYLPFPLASVQPQFSAHHLEPMRDGTFDQSMERNFTPLAWSPLAGGALVTGEGVRPELMATLDKLSARENVDRAAVALAFVLAHPSRPVALIGTQTVDRIQASKAAYGVFLDRADCYEIVQASEGASLP